MLKLEVGGGGGYGKPEERDAEWIAIDLLEGFYDEAHARKSYPAQVEAALLRRDQLLAELRQRSEW